MIIWLSSSLGRFWLFKKNAEMSMLCRFESSLIEILYSLLQKRFERGRACPADHGWDVVADDLDRPPAESHGPQELPDQLRPLQVRRHPVHLVPRRLHRRHSKPPTAGVQGTTYISVHSLFITPLSPPTDLRKVHYFFLHNHSKNIQPMHMIYC